MTDRQRSCLSYWFPTLKSAGVPVPRTEIVRTGVNLLLACFGEPPDGPRPEMEFRSFVAELTDAARRLSPAGPWFLRTGQGSGKHNWKNCCHVTDLTRLDRHVAGLVEWSECVDFLGLPWNVWAVREMLPTEPVTTLPRYGDMPLVREVRAFIKDGRVVCTHPYWPAGAVREGLRGADGAYIDDLVREVCCVPKYLVGWAGLLDRVADAFAGDGAWSVDVLDTARGWYVTDMAPAESSWHWPGCATATKWGWDKGR